MARTVSLPDNIAGVLDALVADEGLPAEQILVRAILERASRAGHRPRVLAAFAEGDEKYRDLLERLRDA